MQVLRRIWAAWKRVGQFIGDWVGRVVLTVFYFTIFLPFGLGVRLFSDPLRLRRAEGAHWLPRTTTDRTLDDARRQF
jgi:hypothetical protein